MIHHIKEHNLGLFINLLSIIIILCPKTCFGVSSEWGADDTFVRTTIFCTDFYILTFKITINII